MAVCTGLSRVGNTPACLVCWLNRSAVAGHGWKDVSHTWKSAGLGALPDSAPVPEASTATLPTPVHLACSVKPPLTWESWPRSLRHTWFYRGQTPSWGPKTPHVHRMTKQARPGSDGSGPCNIPQGSGQWCGKVTNTLVSAVGADKPISVCDVKDQAPQRRIIRKM